MSRGCLVASVGVKALATRPVTVRRMIGATRRMRVRRDGFGRSPTMGVSVMWQRR